MFKEGSILITEDKQNSAKVYSENTVTVTKGIGYGKTMTVKEWLSSLYKEGKNSVFCLNEPTDILQTLTFREPITVNSEIKKKSWLSRILCYTV